MFWLHSLKPARSDAYIQYKCVPFDELQMPDYSSLDSSTRRGNRYCDEVMSVGRNSWESFHLENPFAYSPPEAANWRRMEASVSAEFIGVAGKGNEQAFTQKEAPTSGSLLYFIARYTFWLQIV
jgi:hypothetical protein